MPYGADSGDWPEDELTSDDLSAVSCRIEAEGNPFPVGPACLTLEAVLASDAAIGTSASPPSRFAVSPPSARRADCSCGSKAARSTASAQGSIEQCSREVRCRAQALLQSLHGRKIVSTTENRTAGQVRVDGSTDGRHLRMLALPQTITALVKVSRGHPTEFDTEWPPGDSSDILCAIHFSRPRIADAR